MLFVTSHMIIAGLYVGLAYYCILPPTGRYCTIVILVGYHLPSTLKTGLSGGRILGSDKNKHGNYRGSVLEVYNIVHLRLRNGFSIATNIFSTPA